MENRRSTRMPMVLPVILSGTDLNGVAFKENTWTIGVNKHGAKLTTSYRLTAGDPMMLGNPILGTCAKARVTRVVEQGQGFEISLELLEPQNVWGVINSPDDWSEGATAGAVGRDVAKMAVPFLAQQPPESNDREVSKSQAAPGARAAPNVASRPQTGEPSDQTDLRLRTNPRGMHQGDKNDSPSGPEVHSLAVFLRASHDELEGLLAKFQDIQKRGWHSILSLQEEMHSKLHQELEAASARFREETRRSVQHEVSVALAQLEASCQKLELKLNQSAEGHQKNLAESTRSASGVIHDRGRALSDGFRIELEKSFEGLKEKAINEISGGLQRTGLELADDLRRRAEVGYEILNGQLEDSAKTLIGETQKQIDALSQSTLAGLTKQAYEATSQQVDSSTAKLKEAAQQIMESLGTCSQQTIEAFEKQVMDLSGAALEKYRKTSESLLHDLETRLNQAAHALRTISQEAASAIRQPGTD